MTEWPWLYITLLTYSRLSYAECTLDSLLRNLEYSGPKRLHIASDGDTEDYIARLVSVAGAVDPDLPITITNSRRGGYGANYNAATMVTHSLPNSIILPLEDDWELIRPLNIDPMVKLLQDGDIGCIRMGYVGYTQELRAKFIARHGYHWLELDPDSPEPHVFSGHPRLETIEYQRNVGLWPEGMECGATEFAVAHRREARLGVMWPVDLIKPSGDAFGHIGTLESDNEGIRQLEKVV